MLSQSVVCVVGVLSSDRRGEINHSRSEMKVPVVCLLVVLHIVLGVCDDKESARQLEPKERDEIASIQDVNTHCMFLHKLSAEEIDQMRDQPDSGRPMQFAASPNQQCFAKCMLEKGGMLQHPGGINVERMLYVTTLHGRDRDEMVRKLDRCRSLYKPNFGCTEAWYLYKCLIESEIIMR